ncbi:hypothetical protein D3C80_2085450 [compost metagenome]
MLYGKLLKKGVCGIGAQKHSDKGKKTLSDFSRIPAQCIAFDNLQLPHSADTRAYGLSGHMHQCPDVFMA